MLFSIIIPTYNRARLLKKTIESILSQEYSDFELIIVDDGSTDDTAQVVHAFNDNRIYYLKKQNEERGAARNLGLKKANGKYVNFFDSDDLMYPEHLKLAYKHIFESKEEPNVICFSFDYLNEKNQRISTKKGLNKNLNKKVLSEPFVHLNSTLIKREILTDNLVFCEDRKFKVCEDWYFFTKLALEYSIEGIQKPTTGYVLHENSTMSNIRSLDYATAITYFTALFENKIYKRKLNISSIKYHLYSMTSLAFALEQNRSMATRFFLKSCIASPKNILKKRSLGIIKNMIYSKRRKTIK